MVVGLLAVLSFAPPGGVLPGSADPSTVVGGQDVAACDFPASVFVGSGGGFNCTASLVHPRVLITAAHCLGGLSQAGFGETIYSPATTVPIANCEGHPDYYNSGLDLAYCVLAQDAPDVPMAPVIMGCEVDQLVSGGEATLAGFGQNNEATGGGGGTKRWTTNSVDQLSLNANELYLLGNNNGSCFGDSGGPAYAQLEDGSWRVIAAVSGPHPNAPPMGCGFGGTYELIHTSMAWIESGSGYDITPCFDADGTWNPDERCTEFPLELRGLGVQWANACAPTPVSGPGESCGPPNPMLEPDPEDTGGGSDGSGDAGDDDPSDGGDGHADGAGSGGAEGGFDDDGGDTGDGGLGETTGDPEPEVGSAGALPPGFGAPNAEVSCAVSPRRPVPSGWLWMLLTLGATSACRSGSGSRDRRSDCCGDRRPSA